MEKYPHLSSLVEPLDWHDFQSTAFGQKPVHLKGRARRFDDLLTIDDINRLLNDVPHPHPELKLYRTGRKVTFKSPSDVKREVKAGATLIFENIDRYSRPLGKLLDAITAESWIPARFNLYMSQPGIQGYNVHYDTHDFLALQVDGCKEWVVYPPTIDHPLFFDFTHDTQAPDSSTEILRCTLEPGDVLYIPRGFWHGAKASGSVSTHLTLALFLRTGIDFMQWLVDDLRSSAILRESLPLVYPQAGAIGPSIGQDWYLKVLQYKDIIIDLLNDPETVLRYMRNHVGRQSCRLPFKFATDVDAERAEVIFYRREVPYFLDPRTETLSVFGNEVKVNPKYFGLLLSILNAKEMNSRMLAQTSDLNHKLVLDLLLTLVEVGAGDVKILKNTSA